MKLNQHDQLRRLNLLKVNLEPPKPPASNRYDRLGVLVTHKAVSWMETFLLIKDPDFLKRKGNKIVNSLKLLMQFHSLIYILAYLWSLIIIFYQYRYDLDYFKLNRLKKGTKNSKLNMSELEVSLNETKTTLKALGAPFMEAHFIVNVIYLFGLVVSSLGFFTGICLLFLDMPTAFSVCKLSQNRQKECKSIDGLVNKVLVRFRLSSLHFSKSVSHDKSKITQNLDGCDRFVGYLSKLMDLVLDDQLMLRLLNQMTVAKQSDRRAFKPLSWSYPAVTQLVPKYYGPVILLTTWYLFTLLVSESYLILGSYANNNNISVGWAHYITRTCMGIICIYAVVPLGFIGSAYLFNSIEQIIYIGSLIGLVDETVDENKSIFVKYMIASHLTVHERNKLNSNLMSCIIHLKIFTETFMRSKQLASVILFQATGTLFALPLLARIHVPYVEAEGARLVVICICFAYIIIYDCLLLPGCHIHSQSHRLYRALHNLQAHLVSSIDVSNNPTRRQPIYNEHLVCLLYKELKHPDTLTSQFCFSLGGIDSTYTSFIKIHFWMGLIVISFMANIETNKEYLFLGDPLRLM